MLLASLMLTVKYCRSKWIAPDQARRYVASRDGKCQACYDEHGGTEMAVREEFLRLNQMRHLLASNRQILFLSCVGLI